MFADLNGWVCKTKHKIFCDFNSTQAFLLQLFNYGHVGGVHN